MTVESPSYSETINSRQWKIIFLASIGSSLEWYDFIIYSIFAQYIARQFFPSDDPFASLTLSFSVLAIGYVARPLGGIVLLSKASAWAASCPVP